MVMVFSESGKSNLCQKTKAVRSPTMESRTRWLHQTSVAMRGIGVAVGEHQGPDNTLLLKAHPKQAARVRRMDVIVLLLRRVA